MFMVILRPLIILIIASLIFYFLYRKSRKIIREDSKKIRLEDAVNNINSTLDNAKSLPKISFKSLKKARKQVDDILKEGEKDE